MASAKHMAKTPEKPQSKHGRRENEAKQNGRRYKTDESEKQTIPKEIKPEDNGRRYKPEPVVKPRREEESGVGKRYKPETPESTMNTENTDKPHIEAPRRAAPTRTISEGGMNRLAARLEARDEKRYAERCAQHEERRSTVSAGEPKKEDRHERTETEPSEAALHNLRRGHSTSSSRVRLPAHVMKSRAKLILSGAAGVLVILIITALLAMPHQNAEPAEAAADPESAVAAEQDFQQLGDWRLVLVNSEVPLPDDFEMTPALFDTITVNSKIYSALSEMMNAAYDDEINLWVASCYRSVEEQEEILDSAVRRRMAEGMTYEKAYDDARLTIQQPGYSEHHTGLAVDFNDVTQDFRETKAYTWLQEHAAEYGFVERYPKDKESITGIDYEPWHYRYVGKEHAQRMNELHMCLEEYVAFLQGKEQD